MTFFFRQIYNGPNILYPKIIGTYCGTKVRGPIKSRGRFLTLYFETDSSVNRKGFKGKYKEVKDGDDDMIGESSHYNPKLLQPLS